MSDRISIRYIKWRDGRPRFDPGGGARMLGFQGRDLKHEGGSWFTREQAEEFSVVIAGQIAEARQDRKRDGAALTVPGPSRKLNLGRPKLTNGMGYVYFLKSGQHIKIGFSNDPGSRALKMSTALSHGINSMGVVQGTQREERQLHAHLRRHRQHGEWFNCHSEVFDVMIRCLISGRVVIVENEASSKVASSKSEKSRAGALNKKVPSLEGLMVGAPGLEPGTR